MIKHILVPLDASEFTSSAIAAAASLAKQEDREGPPCVVQGMGIVDLDQIPTGRFVDLVPRDKIIKESEESAAELTKKFKAQAMALELKSEQITTGMATGSPFQHIIRESVFSDIVVMGHQCSFPPVNRGYDTMHHLYHSVSRPVLLTNRVYAPVEVIMVAMDGTAPASRMLYTLMHLNPYPRARVVLTYSKREMQEYQLETFFQRVAASLVAHGLKTTLAPYREDLESEVPELMRREGAQMLALGAHKEAMLDRLADALILKESLALGLLKQIDGTLFIVN
ncbi:MAG: universal stress protein [Deltaproteobacteria bacterium]|nr:universal stress protein [Deltaproteobacteria bacterium]